MDSFYSSYTPTTTNGLKTFHEYSNKRNILQTLMRGIPVWFIDEALTIGYLREEGKTEGVVRNCEFQVMLKVLMKTGMFTFEEDADATTQKSPAKIEMTFSDISSISLKTIHGFPSEPNNTDDYVKICTTMGERFLVRPSAVFSSEECNIMPDSQELADVLNTLVSNSGNPLSILSHQPVAASSSVQDTHFRSNPVIGANRSISLGSGSATSLKSINDQLSSLIHLVSEKNGVIEALVKEVSEMKRYLSIMSQYPRSLARNSMLKETGHSLRSTSAPQVSVSVRDGDEGITPRDDTTIPVRQHLLVDISDGAQSLQEEDTLPDVNTRPSTAVLQSDRVMYGVPVTSLEHFEYIQGEQEVGGDADDYSPNDNDSVSRVRFLQRPLTAGGILRHPNTLLVTEEELYATTIQQDGTSDEDEEEYEAYYPECVSLSARKEVSKSPQGEPQSTPFSHSIHIDPCETAENKLPPVSLKSYQDNGESMTMGLTDTSPQTSLTQMGRKGCSSGEGDFGDDMADKIRAIALQSREVDNDAEERRHVTNVEFQDDMCHDLLLAYRDINSSTSSECSSQP